MSFVIGLEKSNLEEEVELSDHSKEEPIVPPLAR